MPRRVQMTGELARKWNEFAKELHCVARGTNEYPASRDRSKERILDVQSMIEAIIAPEDEQVELNISRYVRRCTKCGTIYEDGADCPHCDVKNEYDWMK